MRDRHFALTELSGHLRIALWFAALHAALTCRLSLPFTVATNARILFRRLLTLTAHDAVASLQIQRCENFQPELCTYDWRTFEYCISERLHLSFVKQLTT